MRSGYRHFALAALLLLCRPPVGGADDFAADRHEILDALSGEPRATAPTAKGIDLGAATESTPVRVMHEGKDAGAGARAIAVVERRPEAMRVNLRIEFDVDSATLRPESRPLLEALGAALDDPLLADAIVSINGHTYASGPADYNLELSYRRAESVRAFLLESAGLDAGRLEVRGFGEALPLNDNATEAERQLNRRVEIERLP